MECSNITYEMRNINYSSTSNIASSLLYNDKDNTNDNSLNITDNNSAVLLNTQYENNSSHHNRLVLNQNEPIPYKGLSGNIRKVYNSIIKPSASALNEDDNKYRSDLINWTNPYLKQRREDNLYSVVNSECFKTIDSLETIKQIPIDQQVHLLFNENQSLKGKLNDLSKNYSTLQIQLNDLSKNYSTLQIQLKQLDAVIKDERIEALSKMDSLITQCNNQLLHNSQESQAIIDSLLSFANQINSLINNTTLIDQNEVKNNPSILQDVISKLTSKICADINQSNEDNNNEGLMLNLDMNEQQCYPVHSNNSYYYPYKIKTNCIPCSLGISNSAKGYSPLICSPNRNKYIQQEQEKEQDQDQRQTLEKEEEKKEGSDLLE